jgi:small subunit ribosomal protein S8e
VRARGGHAKYRAMSLDSGVFSWASQGVAKKVRIVDVVYNATSNELVRTKTLVKNAIVQIDSAPFRQWYEAQYAVALGRKKAASNKKEEEGKEGAAEDPLNKKRSSAVKAKLEARKPLSKLDPAVEEQFSLGRLYACVASRPGQSGRADGYVLEGKELEFYLKKIRSKK